MPLNADLNCRHPASGNISNGAVSQIKITHPANAVSRYQEVATVFPLFSSWRTWRFMRPVTVDYAL